MLISNKQNTNNFINASFSANLFYKNEKLNKTLFEDYNVENVGNKNTNIFIKNVKSSLNAYGDYENRMSFRLENPLLGTKNFSDVFIKTTTNPINEQNDENISDIEKIISKFTNSYFLEKLENETLKNTLLEKISNTAFENKIARNDFDKAEPEKIFSAMLDNNNINKLDFSNERIRELKCIAKDLKKEIILTGVKTLLKNDKNNINKQ